MNRFNEFIVNNYTGEELEEIAQHGCSACCPAGMTYYNETSELYNDYKDDLWEILSDYKDDFLSFLIDYMTTSDIYEPHVFENHIVWLCTEAVARGLTN